MKKSILVIDDEQVLLDSIHTILVDMGFKVECFSKSEEGENRAIEKDFNLILMDIRMPEKNGALITETILKAKPQAKILVITGFPNDPLVKQALDAGAKGLVKKPFEIGKILEMLKD